MKKVSSDNLVDRRFSSGNLLISNKLTRKLENCRHDSLIANRPIEKLQLNLDPRIDAKSQKPFLPLSISTSQFSTDFSLEVMFNYFVF